MFYTHAAIDTPAVCHDLLRLLQSVETRVVVVSCGKHTQVDHWKGIDFSDMHFKEGRQYDKMHAYGQSKSANVLFAKQIAVRCIP